MEVFAAVEADIIALFLIGVMVFYGRIRERNWREKNVFTQLLIANGALCITDILSWGLEGATFPGAYWVLQLSTLFYNISLVNTKNYGLYHTFLGVLIMSVCLGIYLVAYKASLKIVDIRL